MNDLVWSCKYNAFLNLVFIEIDKNLKLAQFIEMPIVKNLIQSSFMRVNLL